MSLKDFHIVFIACSILLAGGFGGWAAHQYTLEHNSGYLLTAACSFLFALGLIVYSFFFIKKIRRVENEQ